MIRIERFEIFDVDGGWQTLSFLKLVASDGTSGWSEFNEGFSKGLTAVIRALMGTVIGQDAHQVNGLCGVLRAQARTVSGGLNAQAVAAIENACLDLKARTMGVPVYELFGGRHRSMIPVYWSHCGLYRVRRPDLFADRGVCVPRSLDDMRRVAAEVPQRGIGALKTNLLSFAEDGTPDVHMPGFARGRGHPALNADRTTIDNAVALAHQLRAGAGAAAVMIDLNFNFKAEGVRRLADALGGYGLDWLEVDGLDAESLAWVRSHSAVPVASMEAVYGRTALLPYLQARALDVAIVDPMWNGLGESLRMAELADTFHVNVASHLYSGPLARAMSAHFCAAIPNLRIMEMDIDQVPWLDELCDGGVAVEHGQVIAPSGPGWGITMNEDALRRHCVAT